MADRDRRLRESVDLVRRAQGGDREAFGQLLDRYYERVLRIVRARLGPQLRQYTESADVVQETMGQVVRAFERFDMQDEESFVRWLSRLVENRIRDLAKFHGAGKRDRGREQLLEEAALGAGAAEGPGDGGETPSVVVARGEMQERVAAGLARLEERERALIERRNEGRKWADIAAELGFPSEGAARMAHSRAMMALMRAVSRCDPRADG